MTSKVQIVAAVLLSIALLAIIQMVRKRKLSLKYALSWMAVGILLLIVDLFPPILYLISYGFGIATPVNTLFVLGFCFSLILIFVLTVAASRMAERIRALSQRAALLEERIHTLENRLLKGENEPLDKQKDERE